MRTISKKIRLVHLLLKDDPDPQRQHKSIRQLEKLKARGIDYVQVWNEMWKDNPPRENFARPSMFDVIPINKAHYGCFRAFADAATEYFTEDIDAIILCEGDVKLMLDPDVIIDRIDRAYKSTQELGIDYFSLGSKYLLEENILQSATLEKYGDVEITNKIIGIQMIMFPQRTREYLLDVYANSPWDGADLFLNQNFAGKKKIGIFSESPTGQWDGLSVIEDRVRNFRGGKDPSIKRLLYVAHHLSTGGMPQFLLKRVESLLDTNIELHVVELDNYSDQFVVQKNKLKSLLGDNLYLADGSDKNKRILNLIKVINPDIIHFEECPESMGTKLDESTLDKIYSKDRSYQIIETCHNIWMDNSKKVWHPNSYMYCTPYHPISNFKDTLSAGSVVEYPFEELKPSSHDKSAARQELGFDASKTHVLNVGLWTSGKNQGESVEMARQLESQFPGKYVFHFVGNQAGNFREYWEPIMTNLPNNVKVWGERPDVTTFMKAADAFVFNSTWECNPLALKEALSHGLTTYARNLPQYLDMYERHINVLVDDLKENVAIFLRGMTSDRSISLPKEDTLRFKNQMLAHYDKVYDNLDRPAKFSVSWLGQIKLHVEEVPSDGCYVDFIDNGNVVYRNNLKRGHWYTPNPKWFVPWQIKVYNNNHTLIWEWEFKPEGAEIALQFNSSSLGDSIAFMGQIRAFKDYWKFKKVWVATHKNWLFDESAYSKLGIELIDFKTHMNLDLHKIQIGVFYEMDQPWKRGEHKHDWRKIHLSQIASDRLGIPLDETNARPIMHPNFRNAALVTRDKPIVTFATASTAQAKYWNRENGWQDLIDNQSAYHWVHCSKEGLNGLRAEQSPGDLEVVAGFILSSKFFVGISSGLTWFAWALNIPVFSISGFTPEVVERIDGITTIQNKRVCNSCWAWDVFDKGDWNWCPAHKNTERQFECSKEITVEQVVDKLNETLLNNNI